MGHGSGCFGFLRRRKPEQASKASSESKIASASEHAKNEPTAMASVPKDCASQGLVPSKKEYAMEATKRTLEILTGVAGLVGVPLVKEVLDIGVSILSTCETINEVQEKVAELKNRVASYLLVIAKIAKDPDTDPLLKSSQGLIDELQELKECLATITIRLEAISKQNVVLTTVLSKPNLNTIEECVDCFQDAVARFQALRGIHAAQDLSRLQAQVEEVYQLARVAVEKMDVVEEKVDRVQSSVDELRAMFESTAARSDTFAFSSKMPPIPDNFLGRDAVVDRVAEHLASGDGKRSRMCILGPGGMGKTSAALAILDHPVIKAKFPTKNRLWIPCISLTSPSAFLAFLARRLGISGQADPLQSVLSTLEHTDTPYIILLDNFETPWHPVEGAQKFTKEILQALDAIPNLSILLTMRARLPPLAHWQAENLDVLPLEDCRRIYTAIEPQAEHSASEDLDLLLETIGRLPYAVTLMANQAKHSDASPAEVLLEWHKVGSKMLAEVEDPSKGMDSSIELSVKSKYVAGSAGALELLQVLSMLPAGVYREDISIWLKSWNLAALSTLRNTALVVSREVELEGSNTTHYLVLPVVQSYMRQPGRIPHDIRKATYDACSTFLRSHNSMIEGPNDPRFTADMAAIISQESNLQTIIMEVLKIIQDQPSPANETSANTTIHSARVTPEQLDAFLVFVSFQYYARPRLDIAGQLVALAKQEVRGTLLHAHALRYLSLIQYGLEELKPAIEGFGEAKELFLQLSLPLQACEAEWYAQTCVCEIDSLSLADRLQMAKATRSLWESYMGDLLMRAAILYWSSERMWVAYGVGNASPPEVLQDMIEAKDIYLSLNNRPWDLGRCLVCLTRFYLAENKTEEASIVAKETLKLYDKEGLPDTGRNHICMVRCLKSMNNWGPELPAILQDGLKVARTYGSPYYVSLLMEELVELYIVERDWAAAELACEETLKESRKGSGYSIEAVRGRAESNLRYIQGKLVGIEEGLRYLKPDRS